jgi:Asp-tRNA(Asn)/Glu-tRNA(Gln) amidotransferase A subunit family amidase
MPIGVQFMSAAFNEEQLIRAGSAVERLVGAGQ